MFPLKHDIASRFAVRLMVATTLASVTTPATSRDLTALIDENGLIVRWHFQAGVNAVYESNLFWDLGSKTAPSSGFVPDTEWLEGYIKPGLSFEREFEQGTTLYGKVSAVSSYTWGTDAFDQGNTGATTLEEAYIGLRQDLSEDMSLDLSLGPRELALGTGMLISNGATSGFERGALKLGPRKAWEMAGIGRFSMAETTFTGFFLDPNELPSNDGKNELAGFDLRFNDTRGGYIGATFINVLNSQSPYPKAAAGGGAPSVISGARDGTRTLNIYAKTNPFVGALENWTFSADYAYQWNDRIDLQSWAGRVIIEYAFLDLPWSPSLALGYQTFSGDDPSTTSLERFDPLYYEGSPSAWATGSKSASTFINSNVNALSLALRLKPTDLDTITLRYAHIRANELNSPVQFGQATRVDASGNLVTGVTDAHLADDLFLEYSRVINKNTYLTAGISVSFPGAGIDGALGKTASPWTGGFINVVINF